MWHEQYWTDPVIDTNSYGVEVIRTKQTGLAYRILTCHILTAEENRGNHHIYADVLDSDGNRIQGFKIGSKQNDQLEVSAFIDKPDDEPGTNIPMWGGTINTVFLPMFKSISDSVIGLSTNHPDEPGEHKWNTRGHYSFYIVWKEMKQSTASPSPIPGPPKSHWREGDDLIVRLKDFYKEV